MVPYLRNHAGLRKHFLTISAFNSTIIVDQQKLYKVSLYKKSAIAHEFSNYKKIRSDYLCLVEYLPNYFIQRKFFFSYLSMDFYKPVHIECSLEIASGIYKKFLSCGGSSGKLKISNSDEIQAGLKLFATIYGESVGHRIQKIVSTFLESGKYRTGFAHGDFHSRNILTDIHGKPKIIDLDCVRFRGIQDFDALYFLLEMEWSESGKPWYVTIVNYLKGDITPLARSALDRFGIEYSHGLAVSYIVDRMGQEFTKFELLLPRKYLDPIANQILEL